MGGVPRWGLAALYGALGCASPQVFTCSEAAECTTVQGEVGRCEDNGFCSFEDDECPSGWRYGEFAGDGLAGQCVPGSGAAGGTGSGATLGSESAGGDGPETSTGGSSGPAPAECGNGVTDPGEDCDDANTVDGDGCNRDCVASGALIWEAVYNNEGADRNDKGYNIAIDDAGRIALAGVSEPVTGPGEALIQLYAADGTRDLNLTVSGGGGGLATGADFMPSGDMVIGGWLADDLGVPTGWLQARTVDGAEVWSHLVTGAAGVYDRVHDLYVDDSGDIIACGRVAAPMSTFGIWLARFDATRMVTWEVVEDIFTGGFGTIYGCKSDGQGGTLWAASVRDLPDRDASLIQINSEGNETWRVLIDGGMMDQDGSDGAAVLPDGDVLVTGWHRSADLWEAWVRRFSIGSDTASWEFRDGGSAGGDSEGKDIDVFPDGSYVVVGWLDNVGTDNDFWVQRFDSAGRSLWRRVDDHEGQRDRAFQVKVDDDGTVVVVGYVTTTDTAADLVLRRYAP